MSSVPLTCDLVNEKPRLYRKAILMSLSAVLACGAIILSFQRSQSPPTGTGLAGLEMATQTLLPYMIAAMVAVAMAAAVMSILSVTKVAAPTEQVIYRLRDMSRGDLTVRMRTSADDPLREVSIAFNQAAGDLSGQIAKWKLVNRQQWGVLGRIREAVEANDATEALKRVAEMEQNWDRIAEIEQRLVC